jgi:hypothetical protein
MTNLVIVVPTASFSFDGQVCLFGVDSLNLTNYIHGFSINRFSLFQNWLLLLVHLHTTQCFKRSISNHSVGNTITSQSRSTNQFRINNIVRFSSLCSSSSHFRSLLLLVSYWNEARKDSSKVSNGVSFVKSKIDCTTTTETLTLPVVSVQIWERELTFLFPHCWTFVPHFLFLFS